VEIVKKEKIEEREREKNEGDLKTSINQETGELGKSHS